MGWILPIILSNFLFQEVSLYESYQPKVIKKSHALGASTKIGTPKYIKEIYPWLQ